MYVFIITVIGMPFSPNPFPFSFAISNGVYFFSHFGSFPNGLGLGQNNCVGTITFIDFIVKVVIRPAILAGQNHHL
jgi:hypothetical protein